MRFIVVLLISLVYSPLINSKQTENDTFIATNEWKEVRDGQGIPAGLHVRINLQTGKKEAKLLDETEEERSGDGSTGALAAVPENVDEPPSKGTVKHKAKISKTLVDALKKASADRKQLEYSTDNFEKIKRKYKSYNEIKESYEDMRKSFKTDAEVITQLISEYLNTTKAAHEHSGAFSTNERSSTLTQLRILENINYLVHQIDNAMWFIDVGGLDSMLLPLIVNQTNVSLRVQAMRVLGALTQNNPKAQIKAYERNFAAYLSQILVTSVNTDELSTALYAFGSLLRKFPHAQLRVLATSGMQALVTVLAREHELKVKAKAITLVSDLIVEHRFAMQTAIHTEESKTAAAQYAELDYTHWLDATAYCQTANSLINAQLYAFLEQPDLMEYFAQALDNTQEFCEKHWSQSAQLRHTLLTLKNRYTQSQDEYRLEVAHQLDKLINSLYNKNELHDEL